MNKILHKTSRRHTCFNFHLIEIRPKLVKTIIENTKMQNTTIQFFLSIFALNIFYSYPNSASLIELFLLQLYSIFFNRLPPHSAFLQPRNPILLFPCPGCSPNYVLSSSMHIRLCYFSFISSPFYLWALSIIGFFFPIHGRHLSPLSLSEQLNHSFILLIFDDNTLHDNP